MSYEVIPIQASKSAQALQRLEIMREAGAAFQNALQHEHRVFSTVFKVSEPGLKATERDTMLGSVRAATIAQAKALKAAVDAFLEFDGKEAYDS